MVCADLFHTGSSSSSSTAAATATTSSRATTRVTYDGRARGQQQQQQLGQTMPELLLVVLQLWKCMYYMRMKLEEWLWMVEEPAGLWSLISLRKPEVEPV